jgi:hypothetical protein
MRGGSSRVLLLALTLTVVPVLGGCGGDDEAAVSTVNPPAAPPSNTATQTARVSDVVVGTAIGPDRRITGNDTEFTGNETIYAAVATDGSANNATLTARWKFQDGQVVDETSQTISPTGPANTEFHISSPSGLPKGNYTVEILLNGQTAQTKSFEIK